MFLIIKIIKKNEKWRKILKEQRNFYEKLHKMQMDITKNIKPTNN